ncbi:MAG: hypothetical protein GY820_03015 [Gammaproteobacteria bacterium]|nr:hypothetical protein [Gammaproteobacteria bacterium]
MVRNTGKYNSNLADSDPLIAEALEHEKHRQQTQIELIASENWVSILRVWPL